MRRCTRSRLIATLAALMLLTAACAGDDDAGKGDDEAIESSGGESPSRSVVVDDGSDTVIAIVGDAGERNDDTLAVAELVARARAVFTVGDNEYVTEGRTVEAYEASVGAVYGAWIDEAAFFPVPGDHDYGDQCDDPGAPADLNAYLEYFDLPVGPEDETYYDARIDDVHVFALGSLPECHRDGGAKLARQQAWLEDAATNSDAALQIVLLHNPPYSSGVSHGSVDELRWDFANWGVDLVVSGDDHIYERSTHDGVPYVVNGLGGIEAHELGGPIEGSEVLYADAFGALFVTVTVTSAEAAFVTVTGEEIDRFALSIDVGAVTAPDTSAPTTAEAGAAPAVLTSASTWQWQLQGTLDTSFDVDVYDVDLFDTEPATIAGLQADGRIVVCHYSAEYDQRLVDDPEAVCERSRELGLRTLLLPLELDNSFRVSCDD
jgi:tartrate-resistant acid phosphatase type 5